VFDTVDLHFLREQREAEQAPSATARATAERTRESELSLVRRCDQTWVVSAVEKELLQKLAPEAKVAIISNIHDLSAGTPGFEQRRDLLFVGSFRHPPNVDSALWLATDIFPRIRAVLPELRLHLVGADAPDTVRALSRQPGVVVHGHVPDLEAMLDQARISLAPLRYGAGIKGKINQSLSRGLPVVATACAAEGMFLADGEDVLVADDAASFADAVLRLYGDRDLWERLRRGGLENTRQHFSRDTARQALRDWLQAMPARRR
jgi:glycosyltransferase involved in cell wall biosynthesis